MGLRCEYSPMVVGMCLVDLHLTGQPGSLKGKRMILRSIITTLRTKFQVAIAEVGSQDLWQRASLGIACVAGAQAQANSVLDHLLHWMEGDRRVEIIHSELEFTGLSME